MPWRTPRDVAAWEDLPDDDQLTAWALLEHELGFRPGVREWPGPTTMVSCKWSLAPLFAAFESRFGEAELQLAADLRTALMELIQPDEHVVALDWQHECFRFFPSRATPPESLEDWLIPVLPDGDFYLFVASDLRFGWVTHPFEEWVIVLGPLLPMIGPALDGLSLDRITRQRSDRSLGSKLRAFVWARWIRRGRAERRSADE